MELRQMVYFLAVADNKSFSQAANSLYISQPTVTMAIKRLEEELSTELLVRKSSGIELTTEGEIFYRHATAILSQLEKAKAQIAEQKTKRRSLFIGVPSMSCAEFYPIIYQFFQSNNTNVRIRVQDLRSPEVYRHVLSEDIELGLAMVADDPPLAVQVDIMRTDHIRLMLPVDHPLARYERISLEQIAAETIFMTSGKTFTHDYMRRIFTEAGLTLNINESFRDNHTIVNMVAQGFGLYFFPNTTSSVVADNARIVLREVDAKLDYEIGLVYKKDRQLSEPARQLIAHLKAQSRRG